MQAGDVEAAIELLVNQIGCYSGAERACLLISLAHTKVVLGEALESLHAAASACDLYRTAGDQCGECDSLVAMAGALRRAGEHMPAVSHLQRAEEIARAVGDRARLAVALRNLGVCCSYLGRHEQALSHLEEALQQHGDVIETFESMQTRLSLLNARNRHAMSLTDAGEQVSLSMAVLPEWLQLASDAGTAGYERLQLMALGNHAITLRECGRSAEAAAALEGLLPRYRQFGMRPNEGICLQQLGSALFNAGDVKRAHDCFAAAIAIQETAGSVVDLRDSLEGISQTLEALGDYRASLHTLRRVHELTQRLADDSIGAVEALGRHLAKALEREDTGAAANSTAAAVIQILDRLRCAVAIVGSDSQIHFLNASARSLLGGTSSVLEVSGALRCRNPGDDRKLLAALREFGAGQNTESGRTFIRTKDEAAYSSVGIYLLALRIVVTEARASRPLALVLLHASDARMDLDAFVVATCHGLTSAEARVAVAIARGLAPEEIASKYCLSVHTVRTQLKSVLAKTNTSRQTELVSLLSTMPLASLAVQVK